MKKKVLTAEKIDYIDTKIIKELLTDGRQDFTEIARKCDLSESIVRKRFRELKNAGIIVGATVQLDYPSFGYNVVGNILFKTEPQQADQIVEYVRKIPNIHAAWRTARTSEINVVTIMEDIKKLNDVKERIGKIPSTSEMRTYVWTGIRNIRENLSITPLQISNTVNKSNEGLIKKSSRAESKIDSTDKRLVEKLAVNGRLSFRKLAKELAVSTDTVARRYEKLKRNGTIKVLIQLNPAKMGYIGYATFFIALVSQTSMISIVENLCKIPDIVLIIQTSGSYDLLVEAMIKDLDHLLELQDNIANIPDVARNEMHLSRPCAVFPTPREYISTF
jgi:DNA-binding Lrp family transcriptional regulator